MKNPDYNYVPRGFKKIEGWWYPKEGRHIGGDHLAYTDGSRITAPNNGLRVKAWRSSAARIIRPIPKTASTLKNFAKKLASDKTLSIQPTRVIIYSSEFFAGEAIKSGELVFVGNDGKVWRKGKK